jgi:hypothetical protein
MYTPFPSSPNFFTSFLQLFYAEGHISLSLRQVMGKDFFHASVARASADGISARRSAAADLSLICQPPSFVEKSFNHG